MVKLTFEQHLATFALLGWEPHGQGFIKPVEHFYVLLNPTRKLWSIVARRPKNVPTNISPMDIGHLVYMREDYERQVAEWDAMDSQKK